MRKCILLNQNCGMIGNAVLIVRITGRNISAQTELFKKHQ